MNAHERAEHLFIQAEKLGMDSPSESMVASAINDAEDDMRISLDHALRHMKFTVAADYLYRLHKQRMSETE